MTNAVIRPSKDIENEKTELVAKAESLLAKKRTKPAEYTAEDADEVETLLSSAESLESELTEARQYERLATQKARLDQPTRPAVRVHSTPARREEPKASFGEGLKGWLSGPGRADPDARYRLAANGWNVDSDRHEFQWNGDNLNFKKRQMAAQQRTYLSTGGSGTGSDWTFNTFSDKLTTYITYFSPLVGLVDNETTADANKRSYFKVDDTAMINAYTSASSGTEISPTIPDTNLATGKVDIICYETTSGYQKVTYEELRDSAINVEDKVAKANANSEARFLEHELILGTGNGSNGAMQGMLTVATNALGGTTTVAANAVDDSIIEAMYAAIPQQYIADAVWVGGPAFASQLRLNLKDTLGRPLFNRFEEDPVSLSAGPRLLKGLPFYMSSYMPAATTGLKPLMLVVPRFYQLRTVANRRFDVLREKFHPHIAYAGLSWWGGAYLGPTSTCVYLKIT